MSSSNPCKSHSGSFHDSDSESSIEYLQTTQLPMSPNIPFTTAITSAMNVSGLNIDVGNPMAQASSTWSIPNDYVTPIPPNPTNTQMHLSEGPGSIPETSSKANPQSKYPQDFLLNPGQKEKVTGRHHPYASKPRTGNASSSREKIVDDEDENMPLTQSKTNDEPRRENFMAHEQGTQSNSEFTHPPMPFPRVCLINPR
ncbi:hypothetical protein O181_019600 [Austropuccinia psidii MF-1]|uniref:Uncharacterized protein n=1 Tax=Austropuccinia psidii MF-1 TaxID=1389203 RepID=A0A9Q3CAZ8_9BASI|nr:hypothetical protein [Austropuccinia psidii MF-1]